MNRLTARLSQERGWALVSSILVLGILIAVTMPLLTLVDTQGQHTAQERKSESSFNLAEAAFDSTVFVLASEWPGVESREYPPICTAETANVRCPDADMLAQTYAGPDYSARGWTIQVRDDTHGSEYYDPAALDTADPITWDSNKNAKMWVRADARAAEGDRTVVALVQRQDKLAPFPRNSVTAGWFGTNTSGGKRIVDTKGVAAQRGAIAVRCTSATPPPSACLNYQADRGQVSPDVAYGGYEGDTAVPDEILQGLRARARSLDAYHPSGCPQSPAGELVFIESGNCNFAGGGDANTPDTPGVLVVANGNVSFSGNMSYYGLVYAANGQRSTGSVVTIAGAATVHGSIAVDWGGGFTIGSNGDNMHFDDRVFPLIKAFGGAAAVQGTWRELPAS